MAGELGLMNSFRERVITPLNAYRGNDTDGGHDIGLVAFMNKLGMKNTLGQPITMEDVWKDLGKNPDHISLDNLITLSGDVKYLAPEVVREFILQGINAVPWWNNLCSGSVEVASMGVVGPWIQYDKVGLEKTGEVETIAEADVTWGQKTVTIYKKAKGIKLSDEIIYSARLPMLQPFLMRVGIEMAASMNKAAVTTLVNGDQASGDECAVVGVGTANTIDFYDFVVAWARASSLFYDWSTMVTSETMAVEVLKNEEFIKPQGAGNVVVQVESVNRVIPDRMPHMVSSGTPAGYVLLVDPRMAMLHLQFLPLRVESERIANRQMNGTYVSIIDGFYTVDRRARLCINKAVTFAANGFPSWMTPLD